MPNFAVYTDSACDMPLAYLQEYDVYAIPMRYSIDGQEFEDTMTQESKQYFFDKMRSGGQPHTSQVSKDDYLNAWKNAYEKGLAIVQVTLSSGLSGTYESGLVAREAFMAQHPDAQIFVVDSLCASQGQGLLVQSAVKLRDAGKTAEQAAQDLTNDRLLINAWFTVQDLQYLKRGGRVSAASAAFGTMLDIKPVIYVNHTGHLIPHDKIKGRKRAIKHLFQEFVNYSNERTLQEPIYITHADCFEDAQTLAAMIQERYPAADVKINFMGSIIGTHTGPGLLALFFYGVERFND